MLIKVQLFSICSSKGYNSSFSDLMKIHRDLGNQPENLKSEKPLDLQGLGALVKLTQ